MSSEEKVIEILASAPADPDVVREQARLDKLLKEHGVCTAKSSENVARLTAVLLAGYVGLCAGSPGPLQLVDVAQGFHCPSRVSRAAHYAHVGEHDGCCPAANWARPTLE